MNTVTSTKNKTRIRPYELSDVDWLIRTILEEVPKLPHYKGIRVDADRIKFVLSNNMRDESAFMVNLLVNDKDQPVGCVGGYCVTSLMSNDKMTGDLFLFVHEDWRTLQNVIKLITAYKDWAVRRRAVLISATHTGGYRSDAMDQLLLKVGFERMGTTYSLKNV